MPYSHVSGPAKLIPAETGMPPKKNMPKRAWQDIVEEVDRNRNDTVSSWVPTEATTALVNPPKNVTNFPRELLELADLTLTNLPAEKLLQDLAAGYVSATTVTTAFLRRAAIAHRLSNCLTELLPDRALAQAKERDEYFAVHKKPIGPLHGLPISVKEHIGFAGLSLTTGYVAWYNKISEEDAHIIQIVRRAGAVFHCRTTVPQSMMHLETDSNIYGVTTNPYNSNCTAGGSSGGEGALIALGGSCLGIGSDVGGSIRCPSANCGIYGLKPTAFRIPTDGWGYMMAGADVIESVLGPMSTSLAGLSLFMKTILDAKPWLEEPALIPMPWREYRVLDQKKPLRVAVMWDDQIVVPHPPITRALVAVTHKLKAAGIEVVDWKPHVHDEAWAIISSLYFTDGGAEDLDIMDSSGEPLLPLTRWMLKENPCVKNLSVGELNYWLEEKEAYRKEYAKVWNATGNGIDDAVDIILCPVGPGVAPKHNTAKYWNYTSQWNLLDYPGVTFPVIHVNKEVDVKTQHKPISGLDKENWNLYDPEEFHGLPVSLQLVGRRFEDEKVLAILEYITEKIGLPFESFNG